MPNAGKRKALLTAIILSAIILRIGLNVIREEVFFQKPFLLFGDKFLENVISDSVWYDRAARAFLSGNGIVSMDEKTAPRQSVSARFNDVKQINDVYYAHRNVPPLYPLFLALCYYIGGVNSISYFIPQLILGSATCLLIFFLAKEAFDERTALLSSAIAAFYPDLIFWTNFIRVETLFIFLLVLGFWLFIRGQSKENTALIYAGAVVFGLASLTRVTFIPFIPVLFLWSIVFSKKSKMQGFIVSMAMISIIIIILLPWCMRNYSVFGKFTPFTNEVSLIFGDRYRGDISKIGAYFTQYNNFIIRSIAYIRDNPREYFTSFVNRFLIFWSPCTEWMRPIAKVYKGLTWILVFPIAFFGIMASAGEWKRRGLIILFILYYSLMHAASFVDKGLVYRYPIQPFLSIFAAHGMMVVYDGLSRMIKKKR